MCGFIWMGMKERLDLSSLDISNLPVVEELYARFLKDPESLDLSWRYFFEGIDFAEHLFKKQKDSPADSSFCRIFGLMQAYRRHGHLLADINPLESPPENVKELELSVLGFKEEELLLKFPSFHLCEGEVATLQEIIDALKNIYCSKIGFEYMDTGSIELEQWIQNKIEKKTPFSLTAQEKHLILEYLNKSEVFESFLHTKYPGQTRFSLEGNETLIPILADIVSEGAKKGMKGFVLGMAHRGRLNVLTNILKKPYPIVFKEFEDMIPYLEGESGDVKYHKGFSSDIQIGESSIHLHLTANSSCLESVDGIVLGQTRAKQVLHEDEERRKFGAILMHGDGALSGQGVVYETLQMSQVDGFSTGGTIHIATNNQIGYTTTPKEGRSTRYCTDIAKAFGMPVLHVNSEDPESCIAAARLALEIRLAFQKDVFIDLNGYRKYGHNEGDEPSFTQPFQYLKIRSKKPIRQIYLEQLMEEGALERKMAEDLEKEFRASLTQAFERGKIEEKVDLKERFGSAWKDFVQPSNNMLFQPFETKAPLRTLEKVINAYTSIPEGFHLHPKLQKWMQDRKLQIAKDPKVPSIDWGTAECLAFGSILLENIPIRLAGQDSKRGTFSHRHAIWFDQENGLSYSPFAHLSTTQARFDVYNTILSEYAALSFEFGYSWASPKSLVIWEAQYGDFDIGAQIAIDHYIVSAEQKWTLYSSLVLLLPHAYEGAGPEHSSARPERFLQLASNNNIQVVYPTTPAQMFHLLRRQALRPIKKPLIVMAPKSLLRLPLCMSSLCDFTEGQFEEFIEDPVDFASCKRLILCCGKIYYDLMAAKENFPDAAIVRVEQIYPFHEEKFKEIISKYTQVKKCIWVQEEPENMGAWEFIRNFLVRLLPKNRELVFIGRPRSASTATGSRKKHRQEQETILNALRNECQ